MFSTFSFAYYLKEVSEKYFSMTANFGKSVWETGRLLRTYGEMERSNRGGVSGTCHCRGRTETGRCHVDQTEEGG